MAVLGFAPAAQAQKDAAEKAREGGVEHWIEYYNSEQRKPPVTSRPEPVDRTAPVERTGPGALAREKAEKK